MTERQIKRDLIPRLIHQGWIWILIPDIPRGQRGRPGFDGILFSPKKQFFIIEIKIGNSRLTDNEVKWARSFLEIKIPYYVLRSYGRFWHLDIFVESEIKQTQNKIVGHFDSILNGLCMEEMSST
jgi:hypothetical protein